MRMVWLLCGFVLFLNCEDKQSKKKIKQETTEFNIKKKESNSVSQEEDTTKFPVLNGLMNAMEFFLEYEKHHKENKVRLTTDFGTIDILLFEETKFHRANFIYLTKRGYFNNTQFYRVINNFIVQAGNSDDKKTAKKRAEIGRYLLPTDTNRGFTHERGVISMPSGEIDNPYKLASPFEFFIIQQQGGSHFLDGDYTVFGKVIKGMDVVDKIAAVKTDEADWPLKNVYIRKAEVLK
ncbi:MAG: peptidylprolyl isomerase [Flavobacteriales bacterium]|nr:peptidylprolyl isomerase [Flavobacteriia bacterium]NCP06639.1 peptidylprolyl isomerase [Flavobacteriales bacterium]PIV94837.1 MAG: peptidylprolyl isomerase [Flavobacteriaceae bacterium CG17_big_fil_post_rev_8_21_14_2_50_33_15]PIY11512.1 MAG: peptidylprolyl isomerase [Flavobacteriaceae bacterium CG_4_10_14_3_um_filter_33_47]PJB17061.1 MAG: peptidylprolyl isomerase [Flavobacteriaceae bacterium CG_4_9_14_3_um_filter_33_16]